MYGRQRDPVQELAKKAQRAFEKQSAQIKDLHLKNESLAHQISRQHSQSQVGQTMDELKRGEEHYTQVVMLAGYAGFFTLWTQTRSDMSLWMFASTGALISISLFVFVCFELYKAWSMGRFYQKNPNPHVLQLNEEYERINKHWHLIFALSALAGVIAGLSVVFWFVYTTILAASQIASAA